MNGLLRIGTIFIMVFSLLFVPHGQNAEAKAVWGKLELKKGMIGKITVMKDTDLYKLEKNNKLQTIRKLKKGQEYPVYSSKNIQGSLFYGVGGGVYVKKTASIQYEALSKDNFTALVKQALKGEYELIVDGDGIPFTITSQKGNKLSGLYYYDPQEPLTMEGDIIGNKVVLRVYFDDHYDLILDSLSYLEEDYGVPQAEIEKIAEQLTNNDDYHFEMNFTIADHPSLFKGQFFGAYPIVDERKDVIGTGLEKPFAVQIKKLD